MLRDATQAALFDLLDRSQIPYDFNRAENFLVFRETKSKILFRAVEEFERLRGSNLAWFGLDELTYTAEHAWLRLEGRLRDPRAKRLCGFGVWTPKGYDWVYERFIARRVDGYETVVARPFENQFLLDKIPDYYERLKSSYDSRFYEQEVLGQYTASQSHTLYLGTRYLGLTSAPGASVSIKVDGVSVGTVNLFISQEDVLIRWPVGQYAAGTHTITVTHAGPTGDYFYFDFFETAVPTQDLPTFPAEPRLTLATDWDTLHSISIGPERTAWFIDSLGFTGRQNHYVGALWFYELVPTGFTFASATVTFGGTITVADGDASQTMQLTINSTAFTKTMHPGDTPQTLAIAFAQAINDGSTGIRATYSGSVLTITSLLIGAGGNSLMLSAVATNMPGLTVTTSGSTFSGGVDGNWRTDLVASPRLNRAVRDWCLSYFTALHGYGIDAAASFSMELGNGDPSSSVGIAQEGPAGDPILLPTPSLQTNFSPTSLAYWQEVYAEMAGIQAAAGLAPFLQFGEVQWWYFPNNGFPPTDPNYVAYSGMPFYDAWSKAQFLATYGHAMTTFTTNTVDPTAYPDEVAFFQAVLGDFTASIMTFVRTTQPSCRFEVLYPTDVNATAFNSAFNFPPSAWMPSALTILKTECFGYTLGRDLNHAEGSINFGAGLGFAASQRSHLVGVGDSTTAWLKEVRMAQGKRLESVVLFALDQYCLIGYETPLPESLRRSIRMGT